MNFRTIVNVPQFPHPINYNSNVLFMGSCFTDNIGGRMLKYKFPVNVNPFGVVYNPASIVNSLKLLLQNKQFTETDLHYHNGLWFSYACHSSFSSPVKELCLANINSRLQASSIFIKQTDYLFITLGTAYAYKLNETGVVVANCHKTPASSFNRFLLQPEAIVDSFANLIGLLLQQNPAIKIIFSVSPVRHLKDGTHGNQISKSSLFLAINELQKHYAESCFYFPAYELLLDDLRDYRFYDTDMCHPSAQAVDYIWGKFKDAFIYKNCYVPMHEIDAISAACTHRPFNAGTEQHKAFQLKIINNIKQLQTQYPFMDFTAELQKLSE